MCNEGTSAQHLPVELQKLVAVSPHGEIRDPPRARTKNPHDCANVQEFHAASGRLKVRDEQSGPLRAHRLNKGIACVTTVGKWAEKEFDEFER
jgi:hypothetical protein